MSTWIVLGALVFYFIFYFSYGRNIQKKLLKSHEAPEAPAKRLYDGVDYVPTSKYVLFGHHFASIAGAGPITGPAMAVAWGWLPGLLWIWIGNVFIGAVHDYLSLTVSVRYDGRSVQYVAQDLIGKVAGKAFGWFILFLCILLVAAFGDIVAGQFASNPHLFPTFLFFCIAAIFTGLIMYRTKVGIGYGSIIGAALIVVSFWLGSMVSIPASKTTWFLVIFVYIIIAAALPVNILLQPRDYLNSFLLYFGLLAGGVAALIGFAGFDSLPVFTSFSAKVIGGQPSPFWPTVPLVIACGALSGFHSLVASGTSSKQLREEKDALFVGYGGMLTEGFLSTLVVVSIATFGNEVFGDPAKVLAAGPLDRFVKSYGAMVSGTIPFLSAGFMQLFAALWVSSFALTTLDTTNRLGRYILHELALPLKDRSPGLYGIFQNKWIASFVVAAIGLLLASSGGYTRLWPAFSGANQLIASIAMLTATVWVKKKLNPKYTNLVFIPAIFLWITVTAGLIWYEIVIVPTYFGDFTNALKVSTGIIVGTINIVMLILNVVIMVGFFRHFRGQEASV